METDDDRPQPDVFGTACDHRVEQLLEQEAQVPSAEADGPRSGGPSRCTGLDDILGAQTGDVLLDSVRGIRSDDRIPLAELGLVG